MKKILYSILLAIFGLLPISVLAEGYISVSSSSLTIEQGSSKTFTITAYNAIGDVSISSNNSGVASVSSGEWGTGMVGENETKMGSITVSGNSVGTAVITLVIDAATFDGDDLAGQTKTITVNVVAKPTPAPAPQPPQPSTPQNALSTNNNIKSLSIEGYELVKVDNNYTLTVANDVTSVNVNATSEDSKAQISGVGAHELEVGENNIEVIVTSESGAQNKINIIVTRKDGYYLEDLDIALKDSLNSIIINNDTKITKQHITKIKDSKKIVKLNYYDENKKLIYSWSINGKEIKKEIEFETEISYKAENIDDIYKSSNYADGLYVDFKHSGNLPKGTKIKLYVGNKFENKKLVNVYHYNEEKKTLEFIQDNLKVEDGYIEFNIEHCSKYFVTMSNLVTKNNNLVFIIISIIELIIIIILAILYILKLKQKNINIENSEVALSSNTDINLKVNNENSNTMNANSNIERPSSMNSNAVNPNISNIESLSNMDTSYVNNNSSDTVIQNNMNLNSINSNSNNINTTNANSNAILSSNNINTNVVNNNSSNVESSNNTTSEIINNTTNNFVINNIFDDDNSN